MASILGELPKTYSDSAKTIIQQHLRRNTSGTNSPSSPMLCSSPKMVLSPQLGPMNLNNYTSKLKSIKKPHKCFEVIFVSLPIIFLSIFLKIYHFHKIPIGPRSRQSSVEANDIPLQMNTEEVYRSLRRTTAEIQNYSFETKLGRDTNSKDSGISQMDEQPGVATTNEYRQQQYHSNNQVPLCGINGYKGIDNEDSCNGSKTQSAATTESNTPENTIRMDGDITTRSSFTAKHSNNVTFMSNGDLITECT